MGWMTWPRRRTGNAQARLQPAAPQTDRVTETKSFGFVALHREGSASWTPRSYAALSREGYMHNPVAYRSVRLICEAAASVPWLLYEDGREIDAHPLLALIRSPNQQQSGADFFETLYGHLMLSGNAYVEALSIDGVPRELHLLRPDQVRAVEDRNGWVSGFVHETSSGKRLIRTEEERLLHLKLFHPLDMNCGFPPLEAATMALDLHNAAARWNKALLDNSARPSGALVYAPKEGGNLSDEQYERLKEELEDGYTGARRAGRPLLLEGGLDWKAMGLTPREMDFVEAKNGAARDIALAFGVPPMLLGIPGDNTYANYQEANRAFYRLTVLPLLSRTTAAFSNAFGPRFGSALRLAHDDDEIAGLAIEREAHWRRLNDSAFLSDDEKRAAVGYAPRGAGGE
jgi:HK97 family phage portal protein